MPPGATGPAGPLASKDLRELTEGNGVRTAQPRREARQIADDAGSDCSWHLVRSSDRKRNFSSPNLSLDVDGGWFQLQPGWSSRPMAACRSTSSCRRQSCRRRHHPFRRHPDRLSTDRRDDLQRALAPACGRRERRHKGKYRYCSGKSIPVPVLVGTCQRLLRTGRSPWSIPERARAGRISTAWQRSSSRTSGAAHGVYVSGAPPTASAV